MRAASQAGAAGRVVTPRTAITFLSLWYTDGMTKQITLRLPDELHEQVKALAERDYRSLHAQMLVYAERGVKQDQEAGDTK